MGLSSPGICLNIMDLHFLSMLIIMTMTMASFIMVTLMMAMMIFTFLTILVVLWGSEDLLEYNVDPILDSAHLDSAAIWKLFPSPNPAPRQPLHRSLAFSISQRNAEMHLD